MKHTLFFFFTLLISHGLNAQSGANWYHYIDKNNIAIEGYDLVAYHTMDRAQKGKDQFSSSYEGITYLFGSRKNQLIFEKNPEQYLPAFGGWCTYFMGIDQSTTGFPPTRMTPNPESFQVIDGRLHLFRKTEQQDFGQIFSNNPDPAILERAGKFWQSRASYAAGLQDKPEGLNAMARMENLDWLPFIGTWQSEVVWWNDSTGATTSKLPGEWTFEYGYNGHCVIDRFISMPDLPYAGTQNGPAIRGYDVVNHEWHMTYIPVNQPRSAAWLMKGKFIEKGHLEGVFESKGPYGNDILQKVVFRLTSPDTFEWSAHWSWDDGKTWKENTGFSECKRIR